MKELLQTHTGTIISSGLIVLLTFLLAITFSKLMTRFIKRSSDHLSIDPTNYNFLRHTLSALIYIIGLSLAVYVVPGLRGIASSMLAGAGILAVAIGFASQQALSNIIAGVFIVIFKPFRVNDRVIIKDTLMGVVEDITLRHTVIRNFENRRIIIPNSVISNEVVINADLVDTKICRLLEMGISYESDVDKAKSILQEEVLAHPNFLDNRTPEEIADNQHPVTVRVIGLGDSSVNLRAYAWAPDQSKGFVMYCDLLENVKKRFDKEGIEIPFPHRTLVYKSQMNALEVEMKNA